MERYVIVIPADEEQKARLVRCDDGDTCKLETLQELVGGCIETAESCLAANWAREDVDSIRALHNARHHHSLNVTSGSYASRARILHIFD